MKLLKKLLSRLRGEQNIDKLVRRGLTIGRGCKLGSCIIDPSHCFHITIGDNVTFGPGVHVLAHDASTKLFLDYTRVANVSIGSNVFIGAHSIVLPGVTIGDNVIIGAGSVVNRNIPSASVAVGVPARVIKPLAEYLEAKKKEMSADILFGDEYTLRNPDFSVEHRQKLVDTCNKFGQIYVK